MRHECRITVLGTKCFPDLQEKYPADPGPGACPFFKPGDTFLLKRTPPAGRFLSSDEQKILRVRHQTNSVPELVLDAISRYVYTALQGGSTMKGWINDDCVMIACSGDGTRPVIFKIERIDIPESGEEPEWLAKLDFRNTAEDAYTG